MREEHYKDAVVFQAVMHADAGKFKHFLKELSISNQLAPGSYGIAQLNEGYLMQIRNS